MKRQIEHIMLIFSLTYTMIMFLDIDRFAGSYFYYFGIASAAFLFIVRNYFARKEKKQFEKQ